MERTELHNKALALLQHIEEENYLGYDPYDFYLSPIAKYLPKSILFLHLQKLSPVNIRPLIGIRKGMVTKVYPLMIDSYLNLYQLTNNTHYLDKAKEMYSNMMAAAVINKKDEIGWGRNYPFKTGGEIHDNKKPLAYLDARIGLAIIHLYDVTHDAILLPVVHRLITNILRTGRVIRKDGHSFIGYSPDKNTRLTFNVSMVATELFCHYLDRTQQQTCHIDGYDLRQVACDIIATMIHFQEPDGSWTYGFSAKGTTFVQRDFHQGFIIDSLYHIIPYIKEVELKNDVLDTYQKGYQYLKDTQIDCHGAFFWRYPKKYPIDIHNQAQGILSLAINKEDDNGERLQLILDYTINTFWNHRKHCFSYQKWSWMKNTISYSRWCNAWMLYSMTTALCSGKI